MAKQIKNNKNFLVIQCTVYELLKIEPGGLGICDCCGSPSLSGYIPCVLGHRYYCDKCYKEWVERAVNYPDDRVYEQQVFNAFEQRFKNAKLWGPNND